MHQHLMSKKAISVQKIISKFNTIYQITFFFKKNNINANQQCPINLKIIHTKMSILFKSSQYFSNLSKK